MPGERAFFDTNILVYMFSADDPRQAVSLDLLLRGGKVGLQSLNEFVNVERGKLKIPWATVLERLQVIRSMCPPPVPSTLSTHYRGLQIAQAFGYRVFDALLLAAAIEADCTVFYSEDMQDGQTIAGLTICNPFA